VFPLKAIFVGAAVSVCVLAASSADAQIYASADGNGHLVLSDRPLDGGEHAYVVRKSESIRTTRPSFGDLRMTLYDDDIERYARMNDVRTDLVRAVVQVESGFNQWAKSPKGAMGLMQLMPATMREFGVRDGYNSSENLRGGVAYLRQLLDRYDNNEVLALAAYNAGPGAVDRHGQTVPPYKETQDYVHRIGKISPPSSSPNPRGTVIYKITEIVDGQEVVRYSDHKPATGSYEALR
jgi:soluble lytic murein transglycosylase-like protein